MNWAAAGTLAAWTTILGGVFLFATRAIVAQEIRKLNGTYVRTDLCNVRHADLEAIIKATVLEHLRGCPIVVKTIKES